MLHSAKKETIAPWRAGSRLASSDASRSAFSRLSNFAFSLNAKPTMLQNYRAHGDDLGCTTYREFYDRAVAFYHAAMHPDADTRMYKVFVGPDLIGIDYCFALRAVFTPMGEPVSFYVPHYDAKQFASPKAQLEEFASVIRRLPC